MPATYEPIATTTLSVDTNTITFANISQSYTDIVAIVNGTSDTTLSHRLQFNNDAGSNYSNNFFSGNSGGTVTAGNTTNDSVGIRFASQQVGVSATLPYFARINIFSYTNNYFKTVLSTLANTQGAGGDVYAQCGLWRSQSSISSIKFTLTSGNYKAGTTFTLYGILKA